MGGSAQLAAMVFAQLSTVICMAMQKRLLPLPDWLPRPFRKETRNAAKDIRALITQLTEQRMAEIGDYLGPGQPCGKVVELSPLIVAAELLIVLSRFIFSYEQAFMADLVRYWYAALFLFSSAYTLFEEGHVRVDVFYAGFKEKTRGYINAFGTILLGMTTCWVIIYIGFDGKTSIINSPVANFEVTQTGSVGMFVKYQMAAFLGIFAITMLIQFVSYLFEAVADYRQEAGKREVAAISH